MWWHPWLTCTLNASSPWGEKKGGQWEGKYIILISDHRVYQRCIIWCVLNNFRKMPHSCEENCGGGGEARELYNMKLYSPNFRMICHRRSVSKRKSAPESSIYRAPRFPENFPQSLSLSFPLNFSCIINNNYRIISKRNLNWNDKNTAKKFENTSKKLENCPHPDVQPGRGKNGL